MSSKSGLKSKESFESWESLFRKTLSKDRLLNFSKPAENSIQWIHLLDPFDHQETRTSWKNTASREGLAGESCPKSGDKLPHLKFPDAVVALAQAAAKVSGESRTTGSMDLTGWPLIPFSKVQMFKCEKCCVEFCSPVNHRRHLRVIHRRGVHTEKEDLRSQRQQLSIFWDSLSPEEASKIVDARNLVLEDLAGEKVARALSHLLQQPALFALPHTYVKSGAMLLELVQRGSTKLPLISSELFKILDGSSEKTFPSFGLGAMQRYVFEGGAGKVGLEAKNLVSSLGFLVELNLVKAFIKDKDKEAWRCQTALVEEEEASRKKHAQVQERKRLKKARQKDLKEKEQKPSDFTMAFLSAGSDSSDEEHLSNFKPVVGYDLQSRPSSNAFENLYNRLAGDGSDSDIHPEAVSTLLLSPLGNDFLLGEPVQADDSKFCSEAIPTVVFSALQEASAHDSTKFIASVGIVGSEHEAVESAATYSLNEGNAQAASGSKKLHFKQKRKHLAVRTLEGRELVAPFKKPSWKEKQNLSFRKFSRQAVVNNVNESVDLACPQVALETTSANRVAGFRPMQLMGKPERDRKYVPIAQAGTAIWTKKSSKHSDATCDLSPVYTGLANVTDGVHDDGASVERPEAKAEVPAVHSSYESISTCSESLFSTPGFKSNQKSNLAVRDGGICSLDGHSSAILASVSGHSDEADQAGHILSSLTSMVVGSVVIGSLSISLEGPMAGEDEIRFQSNFTAEAEGRCVFEASEGEGKGPLHSAGKQEESLRALNENRAGNIALHKELERNGKLSKIPSHLDTEEKENQEHSQHVAGEGKSSRSTVAQAVNSKGGRVKVWRPVVSTAGCANKNVVMNHGGKEGNESVCLEVVEHEQGQPISEADGAVSANAITSGKEGITSDKEGVKIESNVDEEGSTSVSTYDAVCLLLSQRWSVAVDASDTVVLCLEENEEYERRSRGPCEEGEHAKDLKNHSPASNKDASILPGHGETMHGFWKQGCSGSAMAASRRLSGKNNNFNVAPRLAGYRYVPK